MVPARLFVVEINSGLIKNHLTVHLVEVNEKDDESKDVDDGPHHEFALFAFIFNMVCHDGIFFLLDFSIVAAKVRSEIFFSKLVAADQNQSKLSALPIFGPF